MIVMSRLKRISLNASIIAGMVVGLAACDNEINSLGGNILGEEELNNRIQKQEFDIVAFNELLSPIQTDNFRSMPLGSYNDPVYGKSDYSFVSQMSLSNTDPDFGIDPVLNSVVISIPYYSRVVGRDEEATLYELDSLYGNGSYDLEIYQNNFFLSNIDPVNIDEPSVFFSDLASAVDSQKGLLIHKEISFKPSDNEVVLSETDSQTNVVTVISRLTPRFRGVIADRSGSAAQMAQIAFWENLILNQEGTPNLQSNNNFQNFFRGLFFKITNTNGSDNLVHLNLGEAKIELFLSLNIVDVTDLDGDGDTTDTFALDSTFTINFGNNTVSFIDNSGLNPTIIADIQAANDEVNGEERLYLKGGPGSMVLLDLFGPDTDMDGEADALTQVIANNWLINEASIEFYVDQNTVQAGSNEPERVILYNFDDNTVLADFILNTNSNTNSLNSNLSHLGRLERVDNSDEDSQGVKYKIILTSHINNVISGVTDNVRLGLAVTQNVDLLSATKVRTPNLIEEIRTGTAISHEGTILHGNLSSDTDKRLKLNIFYTEIN